MLVSKSISRARRGFTLVELLVVIAIIAALTALSFTVITRTLAKSRTVASVNNLKQLYVAAEGFAGDHHQIFPATFSGDNSVDPPIPPSLWWSSLGPYLYSNYELTSGGSGKIDQTFRDKADRRVRTIGDDEWVSGAWENVSYMPWANGTASDEKKARGISASRTENLAGQPYLSTAVNTGVWACTSEDDYTQYVVPSAEWRNNQIIVLYCDGAVNIIKSPTFKKVAPAMAEND